jgi:hypothetical protein
VDERMEKDGIRVVEKGSPLRFRKCKDCCAKIVFTPKILFCSPCYKKRYGHKPNTTNAKTPAGRGVDSRGSREVDTRGEHPQGFVWVHRPSGAQGGSDPGSASNQLQQHKCADQKDRKRRIVVPGTASLLASMGYRLAKTE